jgi:hypothetical protein
MELGPTRAEAVPESRMERPELLPSFQCQWEGKSTRAFGVPKSSALTVSRSLQPEEPATAHELVGMRPGHFEKNPLRPVLVRRSVSSRSGE